ncbi:hypothetical protein NG829_15405 [Xanthomonas sacchari]|uniref:hypothetical protein n=1 Tax=Xanthomonas TaxID=338 RepID=UPI00225DF4AE|nr:MULTISPECIES: hypothetical protein [Xanthomonas]MDY4294902.1 hypothetical protein [Xanthomonas sp. LF02-5]MDY4356600.1 hypothetical protein [Xanthomonas sp. LF04-12]UYK82838.1 hypothetical protein NG829_15405 [Xanthomonas sacchari]
MNTASENAANPRADAHGDPVYRKNPHPTQAYRITMTIEDAPGPFRYVSGATFYDMVNRDACAPVDPVLGMSTKRKEDSIPIQFQKVDDSTYVATIHADGMVDADYYGRGICKFELGSVGVTLSASGSAEDTRFQPALLKSEIEQPSRKTTYFWKGRYPKEEMPGFPDSGRSSLDEFNEQARADTFKVVLTTQRAVP